MRMFPLVIGYGNPLRGDDGVAWRVIEALDDDSWPGLKTIATHQLVPELAEPISEAGLVVFVDATMGETPGEVKVFTLEAAPPRRGSHQTTPEGLMTLAAELFDRRPAAFMVTISGESFELSEVLSLPVALAIPRAVREIITLIQEKTAGPAE